MGDALTGRVLGGRYHVESRLATGGMGAIYLARNTGDGQPVVLKVMRDDLVSYAQLARRFRREARAASRIDNPHVTRILDFGQADDGRAYLALEYVQGPTLSRALEQDGPFPLPRALSILLQVAVGLEAAHVCQVIHRDLNPNNVVLTTHRGQADFVKILDFGLAKIVGLKSSSIVTPFGHTFGTAEYISPEQAADLEVDHRTDIYAFGILAFELLTGQVPFRGSMTEVVTAHVYSEPPVPSTVATQPIPEPMDRLILRCLAKRPADRYQRAGELAEVIRELDGHR
jgi:serine/threonine protein kinase